MQDASRGIDLEAECSFSLSPHVWQLKLHQRRAKKEKCCGTAKAFKAIWCTGLHASVCMKVKGRRRLETFASNDQNSTSASVHIVLLI